MNDLPMETLGTFNIIEGWMTTAQYAKACGVVNRTVVERMERKALPFIKVDGTALINSTTSPPMRMVTQAAAAKAVAAVWPSTLPPAHELVWVWRFAKQQGVSGNDIYRAVLFGKISAWGLAGRVAVRRHDALSIIGR